MATTPMIGPDGSIADVPHESVQQAVRAGARIAFDMLSPDGKERAAVPLEGIHAAIAAGAQLAPSSAGAYAAASVPKPTDPLQHVTGYDLAGPVGDSFSNRIGNRIEQNAEAMGELPAEASREIQQAADGPRPSGIVPALSQAVSNTADAVYGSLQKIWHDYHDPANVVGDVATAAIGGAAGDVGAGAAELKPAAVAARAPVASASDVAGAVGSVVGKQALKFAARELPLVGRLLRAHDFIKQITDAIPTPELAPMQDGLNDLSQAVIQRINAAKAAGLSDVAPPAAVPQSNTLSSLGTPKATRSFADTQDDAAVQQAMNADLEQQGEAAQAEQAREFASRNSMDVPKWQRVVNQKVQQLLDAAEAKQTSSPAVKPYSSAPKAKAAAAAAGAGSDDLTDILKASLDLARKKKSIK
jgi:hypothetical protein